MERISIPFAGGKAAESRLQCQPAKESLTMSITALWSVLTAATLNMMVS